MTLTDEHVHEGGTHVTNFAEDQRAKYIKAVELHGGPRLVVSPHSSYHAGKDYGGALHFTGGKQAFDLSDFWEVFRSCSTS